MRKKKSKIKKGNVKIPSKLIPAVAGVLVIVFMFFLKIYSSEKPQIGNYKFASEQTLVQLSKNKNLSRIQITISPTLVPTDTPKPTPVQEELDPNAFCLNVPVIYYHHIEPLDQARKDGHAQLTVDSEIFDQQMKYLVDRGYNSISADDLVNALVSHQQIPGKPIVVTIDDGYKDTYQYAFQTAKKYNIKLNLMIPTGLLENEGYMSWSQLKEMVDSGFAYAYDHTWSHYSLPHGGDEKDQMEIMVAKTQLEEHLGKPVKIFSYPYGTYDPRIVNLLKTNGFSAAFTTIPSRYQCDSAIYLLKRFRIGNSSLSAYGIY